MADVYLVNAGLVLGLMLLIWAVSVLLRNVSIVDLVWGLGFVAIAWATLSVRWHRESPTQLFESPSVWLLPLCTTVWGVRLSGYLAWRNHGQGEDKRYAAMRERRREAFWWRSLYVVFLLQGVVMWIVSLPIQVGIGQAQPGWSLLHLLGIAMWALGLTFETLGDWQLARFKQDPDNRGRVLDRGLWRYTRHPNYFGDFCVWWGLYSLAAANGVAVWTVFSPAVMTLLLMRVSGVSLLEKSLSREKPDYAEYVRRTNAFFPWFPQS